MGNVTGAALAQIAGAARLATAAAPSVVAITVPAAVRAMSGAACLAIGQDYTAHASYNTGGNTTCSSPAGSGTIDISICCSGNCMGVFSTAPTKGQCI